MKSNSYYTKKSVAVHTIIVNGPYKHSNYLLHKFDGRFSQHFLLEKQKYTTTAVNCHLDIFKIK